MKRFLFLCFSLLILSTIVSFDVGNNTMTGDPPGYTVSQLQPADQTALLMVMPDLKTDVFVYRQINNPFRSETATLNTPPAYWQPDYGLCINEVFNTNYSTLAINNTRSPGYCFYNDRNKPTTRHVNV
jgi:hypothetical protein